MGVGGGVGVGVGVVWGGGMFATLVPPPPHPASINVRAMAPLHRNGSRLMVLLPRSIAEGSLPKRRPDGMMMA